MAIKFKCGCKQEEENHEVEFILKQQGNDVVLLAKRIDEDGDEDTDAVLRIDADTKCIHVHRTEGWVGLKQENGVVKVERGATGLRPFPYFSTMGL